MENKKNIKYQKILIINLGGIGDILLSVPALKALRELYPMAEICGLFTQKAYGLVKEISYIDKIFMFNLEYGGIVSFSNIFTNFRTLLVLRGKHFDLAVNMRTIVSEKSAKKVKFILDSINPKIKAGRDTDGRGYFFDIKIPETLIGEKYEMEYDLDMVKTLGANITEREIDFKPKQNSVNKINEILESEGISKTDILIGVHPGGKFSHRWPRENFIKIMEEIYLERSYCFVITGGPDEINFANEIVKKTNIRIINLAGKTNIQELAALIKRCSLFISNDTGPIHIAAVFKIPLIAIFGPGNIIRYDPRNIFEKAVVLRKNVECAPCENINCDAIKCLKSILPEEVTAAAKLLLAGSK